MRGKERRRDSGRESGVFEKHARKTLEDKTKEEVKK